MKKQFWAALWLLLAVVGINVTGLAPAHGQNLAAGMLNAGGTTKQTSSGTDGWFDGTGGDAGKLIGNNVTAHMAFKDVAAIEKDGFYKVDLTFETTSGSLQLALGRVPTPLSGSDVLTPVTGEGDTPLPVTGTLDSVTVAGVPEAEILGAADPESAMRFHTVESHHNQDDMLLYHATPGAAHGHANMCNRTTNAFSTIQSLHYSMATSLCSAVNGSAYWWPDMLTGTGAVLRPNDVNVYYKGFKSTYSWCNGPPSATDIGICVKMPNHIRFVFGHNMAAPDSSGIMSSNGIEAGSFKYSCMREDDISTPAVGTINGYPSLTALVAAGCPEGSIIRRLVSAPDCWDGNRLAAADGRSNMAYADPTKPVPISWVDENSGSPTYGQTLTGTGYACPSTHHYVIPQYSLQGYYQTRGVALAGLHLSSDEQMRPRMDAGMTAHADVAIVWRQDALDTWHQYCTELHKTCSEGNLGNGRRFVTPGSDYGGKVAKTAAVSRTRLGWTGPLTGTGTVSIEVRALAGGRITLVSSDGWTGKVTALSVVRVYPTVPGGMAANDNQLAPANDNNLPVAIKLAAAP